MRVYSQSKHAVLCKMYWTSLCVTEDTQSKPEQFLESSSEFFTAARPFIDFSISQKNSLMTPQTVEVEDGDWAVGLSDESEAEDSIKRDPDWVETPFSPVSPDTPMVPRQRRSGRRTRSTEASSLSLVKNTGRVKVREKFALHIDEEKLQNFIVTVSKYTAG